MTNKDYVVAKFERVSNLTDTISNDIDTAKKALAGLLTDKDRDDICYDIGALVTALVRVKDAANLIGYTTEDARRELGKEDHNTTK